MKKLILTLLILLIWGCSLDKEIEDPNKIFEAKINQVFALEGTELKLAFEMLSQQEKAVLWKKSLNNKIKNSLLNEEQKELIKDLISFAGQEMPIAGNATDVFQESWTIKARSVFSQEEIYSIAYKLNRDAITPNNYPIPTDCNCNKGALWTCGYEIFWYCPTEAGNCTNPSSVGCGFMFLYPCNQKCKYSEV